MKIATTLAAATLAILAMAVPAGARTDAGAVAAEATTAAQNQIKPEVQYYAWNGKAPDAKQAGRELADALVLLIADNDVVEAKERIDRIWVQATAASGFEGQEQLLVNVALARVRVFVRLGDPDAALQASEHLLLRERDIKRFGELTANIKKADKAVRAVALKAAANAKLMKAQASFAAQNKEAEALSLERVVRQRYAVGDFSFIAEIGPPAQAALSKEIVKNADNFPGSYPQDPLYALIRMNERQAAQLLLANLDAGGYLWKRRVVRAMTVGKVLYNEGTWSSEAPYVCLEPEWLSVLEALLSSSDTALQSVELVEEPFLRDQLTPGIQNALIYGIEHYELDFVNAVLSAFDHGGVVDSALPVFEAAARHATPGVRRFAARALSNYESNAVLRSMAEDGDDRVRASVAKTLSPYQGLRIVRALHHNGWRVDTEEISITPAIGEAERALLRRFSEDSSPVVRKAVANALLLLASPMEDEVYLRLANDVDPTIRANMAWRGNQATDLHSDILTGLAKDESSVVLRQVDYALAAAPLDSSPEPYLQAIDMRLSNHEVQLHESSDILKRLMKTSAGVQAFAEWVQRDGRSKLRARFFYHLQDPGFGALTALDDASLCAIFALSRSASAYTIQHTEKAIREARPSRGRAMRLAMLDESYDVAIRLDAAEYAAPGGGAEFRNGFVQLLLHPSWKVSPASALDRRILERCVDGTPAGERNALVFAVVKEPGISDAMAQEIAEHYILSSPLGPEISVQVLSRWFEPDGGYFKAVDRAVGHLSAMPDVASQDLLRALVLNSSYSESAVQSIVALHREEDLPLLELCLNAEWVVDFNSRRGLRMEAARGIATYLSDRAAEIMLRGLASPETSVRKIFADGLDSLELTRARRERWQNRSAALPTRDTALAELVEMLESKNLEIKVQAIRGIATFGAIEYLPMLIRLLADPQEEVVNAARTAIESLSHAASKQGVTTNPK